MKMPLATLVLTLAACTTATKVMPMGKDTFQVIAESELGPGKAQSTAINKANRFAEERGMKMVPISSNSGKSFNLGSSYATYQLTFRVVSEDDPEWKRDSLEPVAPTQKVIIRNTAEEKAAANAAPEGLAARLRELEGLRADGLITEEEFGALRAEALAPK